jgi:hypothetical protein
VIPFLGIQTILPDLAFCDVKAGRSSRPILVRKIGNVK